MRFNGDHGSSPETGEPRLRMVQSKRQMEMRKALGFGNRV
jgi:hypothetical protein